MNDNSQHSLHVGVTWELLNHNDSQDSASYKDSDLTELSGTRHQHFQGFLSDANMRLESKPTAGARI
jgi:hypothetical protein